LDYDLVYRMKERFPDLHLSINGGIASLAEAKMHLARGMDGVMIGRAAYHDPANVLLAADREIFGVEGQKTAEEIVMLMIPYIQSHLDEGGRLHEVTRHMMGLFNGRPGARRWRRILSEGAHRPEAGPDLVLTALKAITNAPELATP